MGKQKKDSKDKAAAPKRDHQPTKNRKSPRGAKTARVVDKLLGIVSKDPARNRNSHAHWMAQVARLAKLL